MAPPFWRMALRGNHLADDVPVDRWQICRFTPPSHVLIEVGVAHAGNGGYERRPTNKVVEHRGRLHHPRDRDLDLVLLGHGAQLQSARQGAHREHPRRPGQDLRRGPADARIAAAQSAGASGAASCSSSTSTRVACSHARCSSASWRRSSAAPAAFPPDRTSPATERQAARDECLRPARARRAQDDEAVDICDLRTGQRRRPAAAGVLRRLAHRRAPAQRADPPVLAVQRPERRATAT